MQAYPQVSLPVIVAGPGRRPIVSASARAPGCGPVRVRVIYHGHLQGLPAPGTPRRTLA